MGKISKALKISGRHQDDDRESTDEQREVPSASAEERKHARRASMKEQRETPPVSREEQRRTPTSAPPETSASEAAVADKKPSPEDFRGSASSAWDTRLYKAALEDDYLPEIFKTLRSRIIYPGKGKRAPKTIMITSVAAKEGKSFVTANLGISIAQGMDQHCLLVNCDLRRPSLSSMFGVDGKQGLVDYLRDRVEIGNLLQKTSLNKLSILPSGKTPRNPAELLGSSRMSDLIPELAERYQDRFIIFDSPPVLLAAEALVLTQLVDSIILVVREGVAGRYQISKLLETIGKEKILGVVFNGHTTNVIERSLMKGYGNYPSYPTEAYS
ncbi:MAG TPA: polysaccharide biosynthesis tyrosine autokinase [Desulfopila sp.]|nr:polysaccharide biosynthesis tyrosine autokinase [Desulfopila sp.]